MTATSWTVHQRLVAPTLHERHGRYSEVAAHRPSSSCAEERARAMAQRDKRPNHRARAHEQDKRQRDLGDHKACRVRWPSRTSELERPWRLMTARKLKSS